jgi:hypothetical protein
MELAHNSGNAPYADHSQLLRSASTCGMSIALPEDSGSKVAVHIRGQANRRIAIHSGSVWGALTIGSGGIYNNGVLLTNKLGGRIQLLEMAALLPSSFAGPQFIEGPK